MRRKRGDYNSHVRTTLLCGLPLAILAMGCVPATPMPANSPTPEFVTATLPVDAIPSSTATAAAPTTTPTPVVGTTTTQLNVRAEPQAAAAPLGMIPAAASVQIIGQAPGGDWYEILHQGGIGWVASQYVSLADKALVPAATASEGRPMASVREQIFVRAGPGTSFETLGTQSARDIVRLAGKNAAGTWIQIEFAGAPDGRGWVAASFLVAAPLDSLPIVADGGEVIGTATATGTAPAPTQAIAPAPNDDDSAESPIADVQFGPNGIGALLYDGEVSAPEGDADDWVRFQPYLGELTFRIQCYGNATLSMQLMHDGEALKGSQDLACGKTTSMILATEGAGYTLRLSAVPADSQLGVVHYRLQISNSR